MPRYTRKPIIVDAIKFDGENQDEIEAFVGETRRVIRRGSRLELVTPRNRLHLSVGDYVARDSIALFTCSEESFLEHYEPVEE